MKNVFLIVALAAVVATILPNVAAASDHHDDYTITVDGVQYQSYKVVGNAASPTVHFNTPDVSPVSASTDRHVWSGNGSEHLPCANGIHWIDNKNVLTISHCLEGDTPTTTVPPTTTTTVPTTTTTVPPTTTTVPPTTTTVPPTTTTVPPTTTTVPVPECLGPDEEDPRPRPAPGEPALPAIPRCGTPEFTG